MAREAESILVIDVGSSNVRATVVTADGTHAESHRAPIVQHRPGAGMVEIDGELLVSSAIAVAEAAIGAAPSAPGVVALTVQRASTALFHRSTGHLVGPVLSWQDIRTTGECLMLRQRGLRLQPSQSATKLAWLLAGAGNCDREELAFGTLETLLAHRLSLGAVHVTDPTNAAVTGLVTPDASTWDRNVLEILGIPEAILPEIVDSTASTAPASAITGAPLIAGLVGDQQASLIGQSCLDSGAAKLTFGTGGMLDRTLGRRDEPPDRGANGTFPIVAWRDRDGVVFGVEGMILSAGSTVDWLVDGLGILKDAAESEAVAGSVRDPGGVTFVPALGGLGTPVWDYGARGCLVGISGSTSRAEVVRAVLEGLAHRARDLVEAIEADSGTPIAELGLDGGMSENRLFVQLVANALERPVLRSGVTEATTLGAAMLGGVAAGRWSSLGEAASVVPEPERIEPTGTLDRERWLDARERALRTVPALSMLSF